MASIQANFVLLNGVTLGVTLPAGMDSRILDNKSPAFQLIIRLDPTQIRRALDYFDKAMSKKKIHNQHAYLCNILENHLRTIDSKNNPRRHVSNSMSNQVSSEMIERVSSFDIIHVGIRFILYVGT